MSETLNRVRKYCRWCGVQYYAAMPFERDGFCSPHCKQAHYRAFKKYVTARARQVSTLKARPVTPSKAKKKGKKNGKVKKR